MSVCPGLPHTDMPYDRKQSSTNMRSEGMTISDAAINPSEEEPERVLSSYGMSSPLMLDPPIVPMYLRHSVSRIFSSVRLTDRSK
jgi:hypothetical protein